MHDARKTGRRGNVAAIGLVLAAALALAPAGCAPGRPTSASVIKGSTLRLLPAETVGLAVVEVARMKDREAVGRWLDDLAGAAGQTQAVDTVRAAIGKDLLTQVDRVSLALVPGAAGLTSYAFLAEGRFDEAKMKTLTGGQEILTILEIADRPDLSLTVLPGGQPAAGPRAVLSVLRANLARSTGGLGASRLESILDRVDPTSQAWGAIDYAPLADMTRGALQGHGSPVTLPPPGSKGTLLGVGFQTSLDKTVEFELVGVADAEPSAKQLADAARGLVALARMGASQSKDATWLGFLDSLTISQKSEAIRLHGTLGPELLRVLADRWRAGAAVPAAAGARP
ncbi:MAG TPA: hypothetical protein VFB49_13180 [Patescibacteria group bacterium]|nr:hypothetical protein [Patescibacteria group bacterium]